MKVFVTGMSYRTAPVEVRERLAVQPAAVPCCGCRLKIGGDLAEVVVLSTCNRVEIYGVTERRHLNSAEVLGLLPGGQGIQSEGAYLKQDAEAVTHLFSVASGLDSMVIGETEITGQVKQAYLNAQGMKLTGKVTNRLFQTALQTAKEIRTRTQVGRGATSVGSMAVELAEKVFDRDLSRKNVMIIGAGKMGEACLRHLAKKGPRSVLVCNRSLDRASALAAELGGRAVALTDCLQAMIEADIVVSSTGSPQTILHREDLAQVMRQRGGRPLFLIDIAVPRDVDADVAAIENVYLYDIDDLEMLVKENVKLREQELGRCHAIIAERTAAFMTRLNAGVQERLARQPFAGENGLPAVCPG